MAPPPAPLARRRGGRRRSKPARAPPAPLPPRRPRDRQPPHHPPDPRCPRPRSPPPPPPAPRRTPRCPAAPPPTSGPSVRPEHRGAALRVARAGRPRPTPAVAIPRLRDVACGGCRVFCVGRLLG